MGQLIKNTIKNFAAQQGAVAVDATGKQGITMPAVPVFFSTDAVQLKKAGEKEPPLQKKPFQLKNILVQKSANEEEPLQKKPFQLAKTNTPAQTNTRPNQTGMPDNLKAGVEALSGIAMDDVKVHYNSDKPAQLQALAYAQGTDIHIAPGQEKHLPHEAWHVVQQKQGRVRPTMQMKGGVAVNDDKGLEREADVMGGEALKKTVQRMSTGEANLLQEQNNTGQDQVLQLLQEKENCCGYGAVQTDVTGKPTALMQYARIHRRETAQPHAIQTTRTVQRVIKEKSGRKYTQVEQLPESVRLNVTIGGWATAAENTLVQSFRDLEARGRAEAAPVLTPHRHLIGESHNASRFEEAVNAWGWGAARMQEGFQRSQTVKEPFTEMATNPGLLKSGMFKGVLPLENTHARTLSDLAGYRLYANLMELRAGQLRDEVRASNITHKAQYENSRTHIDEQHKELMMRLDGYEAACKDILKQAQGNDNAAQGMLRVMATYMNNQWVPLKTRMALVSSSPWNLLFANAGDEAVAIKLEARRAAANLLVQNMDTLAGYVADILRAETDDATGDLANRNWATATGASGNVLTDTSPIREEMMARNINAAAKPLLVGIGSAHVTNLDGQITDGKYHHNYTDFERDVQGP
jgi:hypothetical protein